MLKLKNGLFGFKNITPAVIFPVLISLVGLFSSFNLKKHPTYISLVDIKYKQGGLQICTRTFTNDLEDALKKTSKKNIDILNPKNKIEADSVLFNYIQQHLSISINSKKQKLFFVGYEKEDESIWTYLEIKKINTAPKKISVDTKLLYDFLPNQTNIIRIEINPLKKSAKVTNPESKVDFLF